MDSIDPIRGSRVWSSPPSLRWLKTMVQEKLFVRRADPHDGRRVFVELAPETSYALRRYFAEVGQVGLV